MHKKATIFQFTKPLNQAVNLNTLGDELAKVPGLDCGRTDKEKRGFVPVIPGEEMVERIGDYAFIRQRICEKNVRKAAVKRELADRVTKFELQQGRKPKKDERDELEEQIMLEILPHTPQEERFVVGALDLKSHRLIVSENTKKAEDFAQDVRHAIGSLPVQPLGTENSPAIVFAQMINEDLEITDVAIGDACDMKGPDKETATFRKADLHSDEVKAHLDHGLSPKKIQLHFGDMSSAIVDETLGISSLKLTDTALEQQGYDEIDDAVAKGRADLLLWASAVSDILDYLDAAVSLTTEAPKQEAA